MNIGFIPPELLKICHDIVEKYHSKNGMGNLHADIETPDNANTISGIPEAAALLKANDLFFKIRKWCFMASVGFVILAVLLPWWSLATLALIFLADRLLVMREKKNWKLISAIMLSLDFLSNDFAGWGAANPRGQEQAMGLLKSNPQSPKTMWLDYYLPKRAEMEPSQLKALEPNVA